MVSAHPSTLDSVYPSDLHPISSCDYEICSDVTDCSRWHPKVSAFYAYWRQIKPPGKLPGRQHFDPANIATHLPRMWLFDVSRDPLTFRVRLIGSHFARVFGKDITGNCITPNRAWYSPGLSNIARFERAALEGLATYRVNGRVELFETREQLRLENVTVPLARDGLTVDMLAGYSWITTLSGEIV